MVMFFLLRLVQMKCLFDLLKNVYIINVIIHIVLFLMNFN